MMETWAWFVVVGTSIFAGIGWMMYFFSSMVVRALNNTGNIENRLNIMTRSIDNLSHTIDDCLDYIDEKREESKND